MADLYDALLNTGPMAGLTKASNDIGESFLQNKLKMAMMSKQMELEAQNRMAETQQQHELGMVPEEQYRPLLKSIGVNIAPGAGPVHESLLNSVAQGNSRSLMANVIAARSNTQVSPVYDPQFGIKIGERETNGLGGQTTIKPVPDAAKKLDEARLVLNAKGTLNRINEAASQINFGRVSGLLSKGQAALGFNPEVTKFNNLMTDFNTMKPAFIAGFKRFNDPEYQRLANQANLISTPIELKSWLDEANAQVSDRESSLGIGEDPSWKGYADQPSHKEINAYATGAKHGMDAASQQQRDSFNQSVLQRLQSPAKPKKNGGL